MPKNTRKQETLRESDPLELLPGETLEEWDRRMDAEERSPGNPSRMPLKFDEFFDPHLGNN